MIGALLSGVLLSTAALPASFPEPKPLAPRVRFWVRTYTEWRSDQVIFHDAEHLSVVYDVLPLGKLRLFPRPRLLSERRTQARARRALIAARLVALRSALYRLSALQAAGRLDPHALHGLVAEVYTAFARANALSAIPGAALRLRWQYGLADRFRGGLDRYDAWRGAVKAVFDEEGVPEDLMALAFVESLFDPDARSHAGAAGIFQLMPATGRELGLHRNRTFDARRDPLRAARAAARMLRKSYERLGSWPLAITAYNHGPYGVARAVAAVGSHRLVDLIDRYEAPSWGFASKNFYAEFLAAREVLAHRYHHFGDWVKVAPISVVHARVPRWVTVAALGREGCVSVRVLARLNPALRDPVVASLRPIARGTPLNLPARTRPAAFVACAAAAASRGHGATGSLPGNVVLTQPQP